MGRALQNPLDLSVGAVFTDVGDLDFAALPADGVGYEYSAAVDPAHAQALGGVAYDLRLFHLSDFQHPDPSLVWHLCFT